MTEAERTFWRLVRPYWDRLHRMARRYVLSTEDADDLVQEVLLRAWGGFSPSEQHKYCGGWLFVILRHVAVDWARAKPRCVKLIPVPHNELTDLLEGGLSEALAPLPTLTEERFREFLDDTIASALDALEPVHREAILLSVIGELTYREIADVLECPVGTVMSRMARARRALRERLADYAAARERLREGHP